MGYSLLMKEDLPPFGPTLRQFRQKKNLSQEELAARLDISPSYVSRMESDFKTPSLAMLFRLAHVLEVRPYELIKAMERQTSDHVTSAREFEW